jgi:hypothetical protein
MPFGAASRSLQPRFFAPRYTRSEKNGASAAMRFAEGKAFRLAAAAKPPLLGAENLEGL